MIKKKFFILSSCLLFYAFGVGQNILIFDGQPKNDTAFNIIPWTSFYDDVSGKIESFEVIKEKEFRPVPIELLQGFIPVKPLVVNWLKFTIRNTHVSDTLRLIVSCNLHASVQLYHDGATVPLDIPTEALRKTIPDKLGLPVIVPPIQTITWYVRVVERIYMLTPLTAEVFTPGLYFQEVARQKDDSGPLFLFMNMALGSLLFMLLFAVYQYMLLRDISLLFYAAYVSCAFIVWLIISDQRFDLHIFESYRQRPHILASSGIAFFYGLFIAHMLELPARYPKKWKVLRVLLFFILMETLLEVIENISGHFLFDSGFFYSQLIHIPNLLVNAYLIWLLITVKSPLKKYLLSGLLCLFFFLFVISRFAFSFIGLSPKVEVIVNFPPFWGLLGVVTEALCFAFALAYRYKLIQVEKKLLQQTYASHLKVELDDRIRQLERQHRLLEEQKVSQLEIAFEKKLAETEMTALRAQMNPHFIFNCLNSIKLYTLEHDAEAASGYLTTFAKLIRQVLDNSRSDKVLLENEIETLRLYIELERMRFKNKVTYEINIQENVDIAYIEIPPLLLQPYIENAIWHGLMHKNEGGKVVIDISLQQENTLHVEITDDGIGREMAAVYKSKSISRHKSYGIRMTSERLQAINQLFGTQANVVVIDLKDDAGYACGTKIILDITI